MPCSRSYSVDLVHPALADERHVADDAGGREAGQVAHDGVLQPLRLHTETRQCSANGIMSHM
jgi:hypothetical protein